MSAMVALFVDRLASLSAEEWESIQHRMDGGGLVLTMLEASRNAALALAVRDLISRDQFEHLYRPFTLAIPVDSLGVVHSLD